MGQAGVGLPLITDRIRPASHVRGALSQCRVRHHGDIARIEIAKEELPRALTLEMFLEFTRIFKGLGFIFVTVDTEGFRSGSMNAGLASPALIKLIS